MPAKRCLAAILLATLAGCSEQRPTPPFRSFDNLPISGSLDDALKAGFTRCIELSGNLRCRRDEVMVQGQGPYSAAVDLRRRDGSGGFSALTLWHDTDQNALFAIGDELESYGWHACLTGDGDRRGDQKIWTRSGAPVRVSMDISFWGKRSLRIIPETGEPLPTCR